MLAFLDAPFPSQNVGRRLWFRMTARFRFWHWIERAHTWRHYKENIKYYKSIFVETRKLKTWRRWLHDLASLSEFRLKQHRGSSFTSNESTLKERNAKWRKVNLHLRGARSYFHAMVRHRLRPYPGRITLVMNEMWCKSGTAEAWANFHKGEIEVHQVAGDHTNFMDKSAHSVAKHLREALNSRLTTEKSAGLEYEQISNRLTANGLDASLPAAVTRSSDAQKTSQL